jgi:hypothetical protein
MKPAQRGMLVALILALIGGIVIGGKSGIGGAALGGAVGVVGVFVLVPIAIAVLTMLYRLAGVDPRAMEERLAVMATWAVAAGVALVSAAGIIGTR